MTCILEKNITTLKNLPTPSLRSLLRSHLSHNGKDHGLCVHGECQNWYHFNHVGLSVAHEPLKEVWFCPKCILQLSTNTQSLWWLCSCCIIIFKLNSTHLFTPALFLWLICCCIICHDKNFSTWHLPLFCLHHNPSYMTLHWDCWRCCIFVIATQTWQVHMIGQAVAV